MTSPHRRLGSDGKRSSSAGVGEDGWVLRPEVADSDISASLVLRLGGRGVYVEEC